MAQEPQSRESSNSVRSADSATQANPAAPSPVLLARQPIHDVQTNIYGYEIRPASENTTLDTSSTSGALDCVRAAVDQIGLDALVCGSKLYLPIATASLLAQEYKGFAAEHTVLELSQRRLSASEIEACVAACNAGYRIAVHATCLDNTSDVLKELAPIVIIDISQSACEGTQRTCSHWKERGSVVLAKHVDTQESFERAKSLNVDLVQGCFFTEPEPVAGDGPAPYRAIHLQFLAELNKCSIDFGRVEELVKSDAVLAGSLIRYLNSPINGVRERIECIRRALLLLGEGPLRRWGSMIAMGAMCDSKPPALLEMGLIRAWFCERLTISPVLQERELDLFLVGLLSILHALSNEPIAQLLASLPIHDDVRHALTEEADTPLASALNLASACERGAWGTVQECCDRLGFTQGEAASIYYEVLGAVRHTLAA